MVKIEFENLDGEVPLSPCEIYQVEKDGNHSLLFVVDGGICLRISDKGIMRDSIDFYRRNFKIIRKVTDEIKITVEEQE